MILLNIHVSGAFLFLGETCTVLKNKQTTIYIVQISIHSVLYQIWGLAKPLKKSDKYQHPGIYQTQTLPSDFQMEKCGSSL